MHGSEVLFSLHQFTCTSIILKLSKSDKKCRKYGQYYIYTLNWSIAFTVSIFLKLINVQWHYVEKFCIDFHWNWSRNVATMDRYSLMPLHTTWLSLCQFSLNSRTQACLTTFCTELLYLISCKFDKLFSHWHKVRWANGWTDKWMDGYHLHTRHCAFYTIKRMPKNHLALQNVGWIVNRDGARRNHIHFDYNSQEQTHTVYLF